MNPKVRDAVQAAIDRCFQMNALCDRMMYIMKSQWNLSIFADKFHHEIAHAYPAIADDLSDILLAEDEDVTRGAVEAQMQSYASITAMMEEYKGPQREQGDEPGPEHGEQNRKCHWESVVSRL